MSQKDDIKKELEELAPSLSKIEKTDPIEPPAGYFEQLPQRIRQRIDEQPKAISSKSSVVEMLEQWLALMLKPSYAAAFSFSLLLMIIGGYTLYLNQQAQQTSLPQQQGKVSFNSLSSGQIEAYLTKNIEQFDEAAITETAEWQSIAEASQEDFSLDDVGRKELDQYIMANIQQETIKHELP